MVPGLEIVSRESENTNVNPDKHRKSRSLIGRICFYFSRQLRPLLIRQAYAFSNLPQT